MTTYVIKVDREAGKRFPAGKPGAYIISELSRPVFISLPEPGRVEVVSIDDATGELGTDIASLARKLDVPIRRYQRVVLAAEIIEFAPDEYAQVFSLRGCVNEREFETILETVANFDGIPVTDPVLIPRREGKMRNAEKRIAEVLRLRHLGDNELSRQDLLESAGLPDDYKLRPWPEFPTVDEVMSVVGWAFFRHASGLTAAWGEIMQAMETAGWPPLVREIVGRAMGPTARDFPPGRAWGYGFNPDRYHELVAEYKALYDRAEEILNKR